ASLMNISLLKFCRRKMKFTKNGLNLLNQYISEQPHDPITGIGGITSRGSIYHFFHYWSLISGSNSWTNHRSHVPLSRMAGNPHRNGVNNEQDNGSNQK